MAVRAQSIGLVAIVVHCESVCEYDPEMYFFEEGTYAVFNGTVRAVAYR